jgi:hypothetical protein
LDIAAGGGRLAECVKSLIHAVRVINRDQRNTLCSVAERASLR